MPSVHKIISIEGNLFTFQTTFGPKSKFRLPYNNQFLTPKHNKSTATLKKYQKFYEITVKPELTTTRPLPSSDQHFMLPFGSFIK